MKKIKLILFLLVSIFYLTGCWDSDELEEMLYIHSIGLDYRDDRYIIYAQLFNFQSLPTDEGAGGEETQVTVGVGEGTTVVEAVHDLYSATQRRIFWGHLSSIIFSESVLEGDIEGGLDVISRFHEIRPTPWIYASNEPLDELLNTLPALGVNVIFSLFGQPVESYEQSSKVKPIKYNRFNLERSEPGRTVAIPVLNIAESKWFDKAGSKPNLDVSSVAIISNENYFGILNEEDAKGIRWYQEETERTPLVIYDSEGQVSGLVVLKVRESKVIPNSFEEQVTFNMKVEVGGSLIEMSHEITEKEVKKSIENQIIKELRHTYDRGLNINADVYNFSYQLFREKPQLWKELTNDGQLSLNEESLSDIKVQVYLRDTGERKLSNN